MKFSRVIVAALIYFNTALAPAAEPVAPTNAETAGDVCINCEESKKPILEKIPTEAVVDCEKKSLLFNPQFQSIFEKNNIQLSSRPPKEQLLEQTLTCIYGLGKGAFLSARDLLHLVPALVDALVKAGKWTYNAAKDAVQDTSWFRRSLNSVSDFAVGAYNSTKEKAVEVWEKSSTAVKEGFQQGGIGGAASAIAAEMYDLSPHHVLKNALSKFTEMIYGVIGREWDAFMCMSPQGQAQTFCSVLGYLITDVATGKLIWGNLAKSGKVLEAIESTKKTMMRTPVIGDAMMANYNKVDKSVEKALEGKDWKMDGKLRLEGKTVEVVENEGKIYARGVDPKTREVTTYEVEGKTKKQIEERLVQNEKLPHTPAAKSNDDFFNPENTNIARTKEDFVRGTNREVDVEISDYNIKKISDLFDKSPEIAKDYGSVLKQVSDFQKKVALESPKKMSKENAEMLKDVKELMKEVNGTIAKSKPGETLNLANIKRVIDEAVTTGDRKGLEIYKGALEKLNQAGGPSRFDTFFENVGLGQVSSAEVKTKVRTCLISSGTR